MADPIVVPLASAPVVTIVLVVWGAGMHVLSTVRSLVASTPQPYELILVDNASPDGSGALVRASIAGARFIGNSTNTGFGPAVNRAATLARSSTLVLLNPDITLTPNWLQPLLETLYDDPSVGMVSALLRNPDGSIQDAGRRVDAAGFTHSDDDAVRSVTEEPTRAVTVQYVSGACLAVRTADFLRVGGFDEQFVPAYFEDVDLCLQFNVERRHVCVEPRSSVVHTGGVSTVAHARQEMFDCNRLRFTAKWNQMAATGPAPR